MGAELELARECGREEGCGARPVGIWEIEERVSPQEGQKRASDGTADAQVEQRISEPTPVMQARSSRED